MGVSRGMSSFYRMEKQGIPKQISCLSSAVPVDWTLDSMFAQSIAHVEKDAVIVVASQAMGMIKATEGILSDGWGKPGQHWVVEIIKK